MLTKITLNPHRAPLNLDRNLSDDEDESGNYSDDSDDVSDDDSFLDDSDNESSA